MPDASGQVIQQSDDLLSVATLRRRFFDEYRNNIEMGRYSVEDVRRVRIEDWWVLRMLRKSDNDVDVALSVLVECLKWRHEFRVSTLSAYVLSSAFPPGVLYSHGTDREGKPVLWFTMKLYKKESSNCEAKDSAIRKLFVYWLEKLSNERFGEPITLVFDMTGSGLQNMDLDLVKFLFHAFNYYFPGLLGSLLVYEIPWVLNAAWKLIRSWLDGTTQRKLIFLNVNSIQEYIDAAYLPPFMGGTDDYQFDPMDLKRDESPQLWQNSFDTFQSSLDTADMTTESSGSSSDSKKKSVKFAEDSDDQLVINRKDRKGLNLPSLSSMTATSKGLSHKAKEIADSRIAFMNPSIVGPLLMICPKEEIQFQTVPGETEFVDVIVIKNVTVDPPVPVAFKVKTTSPEKFRVRPSAGVVKPDEPFVVKVYLQAGYQETCHKDKFLLACVKATDETINLSSHEVSEFWKTVAKEDIIEYRLKCKVADPNETFKEAMAVEQQPAETKLDDTVRTSLERLENDLKLIKMGLIAICCLLLFILVKGRLSLTFSSASDDNCHAA